MLGSFFVDFGDLAGFGPQFIPLDIFPSMMTILYMILCMVGAFACASIMRQDKVE